MIKKWINFNKLQKNLILWIVYSFFTLFISLILLLLDSSWIYGYMFGTVLTIVSYSLIWLILQIFKKLRGKLIALTSIMFWFIRVLIFTIGFCLILFLITPNLLSINIFDVKNIFYPINTIWMLFIYLIPILSQISVLIIETKFKK